MSTEVWLFVALIFSIICIPPVFLLRPLVVSIANRIAGKSVNTDELKLLKNKVAVLEHELMDMRSRLLAIEDTSEFGRKLEDSKSKERR